MIEAEKIAFQLGAEFHDFLATHPEDHERWVHTGGMWELHYHAMVYDFKRVTFDMELAYWDGFKRDRN